MNGHGRNMEQPMCRLILLIRSGSFRMKPLFTRAGTLLYVLRNHLKVMLEEDYLSLEKHSGAMASSHGSIPRNGIHSIGSQIIR